MAAEFKISRFKHTWKGQWLAATVYNPDDIVSVAGKVYNCVERHTADAVFYTDLLYQNNDVPPLAVPKWELIADGTRFAGNWEVDTEYFIGDIVKIGGATYVCAEGHFSAATLEEFENDLDVEGYWTVFFNGVNWTNDWTVETLYQVGDVVKLSGRIYICTEAHTSDDVENPGLLLDIDKWEELLSNINWRGDWATGQIYYPNDIVRYGGIVYKCITQHGSAGGINAGLEADEIKWEVLHFGIEYKGAWSDLDVRYKINDVVKYGAYLYICNEHHTTVEGALFIAGYWTIYCPGNEYQNTWSSLTSYQPGDVVRHGGYLFVANSTNLNSEPNYDQASTTSDWSTFFRGTRIRGEWDFNNTYKVGDVVRRQGQLYIAQRNIPTGTDIDIIGDGSSINPDNWELLVSGVDWKAFWDEDTDYLIGDLVQWKGAAYKCIQRHIAIEANRPDNGVGVYWEQYTYGDPNNVLAYVGDLKKFDTVSTASIAIGNPGQTLAVVNDQPNWKSFNASADVYYVSLNGVDAPNRGTTLNSAWRTVRYALDNITGPATLLVKTGIYDEILPLRIPNSVAVVGDELRGTIIRVAENYFSATEITEYRSIIEFIGTFIDDVIKGITITFRYGQEKQVTSGSAGTPAEVSLVLNNLDIIDTVILSGIAPAYISTNSISVNANVLAAASQISNNKTFITSEVKAWLQIDGSTGYNYQESILDSAINRICDALVYDLRYPGNYKSVQTGVFFYNGSNPVANAQENMFLFGNATGLRNLTLRGLSGTLGALNANLTQRPTAGAYASLDPGWGQADDSVWIVGRSPYIQNVTTFGTACIGMKIDGDLHNDGFKTMVANDFTQILSDGIGVWCNGEGASEIVSIFTYYNHIGYLCTNGGKIRGTNGNCSYGKFGAVAEGFNLDETPITATVNNRYYDATVGQTFTDSNNIVKMFYDNAGQEYTSATYTFAGAGINASVLADEFRDGGVHEVRLANLDDSTSALGSGFTLTINNAQAGDANSVTVAASVDQTPEEFRGLRIVIQSGTGAGQYGYIADYDNTSKIILVGNEYYAGATATTAVAATDKLTLSTSGELQVGDAVCFTGTVFGNIVAGTIYTIKTIDSNDITLDDGFGGTLPLANASGTMTVHRLGWGHFQPGTTPLALLDTTTSYFIEPRVIFTAPPIVATTGGMNSAANWTNVAYGEGKFVAVSDGNNLGSTTGGYSINGGVDWLAMTLPSGVWKSVSYGNGTFVAVASDGKAARSLDGITWSAGTIPAGEYSSVTYGNGVWVAIAKAGRISARSTNDGVTWTQVLLPEGADWSSIAFGKNTFVAVAESDSNLTNTAYSTDNGATWTLGSFVGGCKSIAYGNNRFVAISGGYAGANDAFISFDGVVWTATTIPAANWQSVAYGQGLFVAIARFDDLAATSPDGKNWSLVDMGIADEARDVVFGNYNNQPKFVGVFAGYDVMNLQIGLRAQGRVVLDSNRMTNLRIWEPGSGYVTAPTVTVIDPNNTSDATTIVRIANGVLGNPTILNSGSGWVTTSTRVTLVGDGFTDLYQVGNALVVDGATRIPSPGDNLNINGIDDYTYKVLNATVLSGTAGNYRLRITIAKGLNSNEAPEHNTSLTIRQKYSQVRLTGHDFLDVGLGNFEQTNYPNTLFPVGTILAPENEIDEYNGGRVFYTSTDQDGNFRVGELFAVEQATGTVTISAEFFELQGLEEISIGGVTVGGSGVVIREFSTDPLFVADSNNIIPTQRAIKSYISRRVSGGGSDAFTTVFTAGIVRVGPSSITTTTLTPITIPVNVQFNGIVTGSFLAQAMFMAGDGFTEQF